jgi:hypothetical protein
MGWDFLPVSALRGVVDLAVRLVELGGAAVILAGATWRSRSSSYPAWSGCAARKHRSGEVDHCASQP